MCLYQIFEVSNKKQKLTMISHLSQIYLVNIFKPFKYLLVSNQVFLIWKLKMCVKTVGQTPRYFHSLASVNIKHEIKRKERQDGNIRTFASQSISAYTVAVKQRHVITKWTSWHGVPENVMQICQIIHLHIHEYGKVKWVYSERDYRVGEIKQSRHVCFVWD